MTINLSDNDPRVSYDVAAGVTQSSFAVSFEFFDNDDLNVYVDGVLKTLTTDYTVSGGDGSTGTVTISVTGAAGGSKVVITRDIDLDRTTDFPSSGPFNIASLNTELDRFVAIAADLKDQADRALQLTDFDVAASLTLPEVDDRKGKTLAFNNTTGAVEAGPTISDVQSVSNAAADIQTLAHIEDGTDATDAIQTVAGISGNVTTVAGISSNVTTVAGISSDVTAVAGDEADIGTVSTNISNVNTVAGISANVTTVAGISSDVTSVAGDATDIGTVATNIADVNTAASNITEIQNASTNAATATTKAAEAATSATTATTQATTATTQATNAATSATNAATSATNASTSATNAANSATAAAASQTAAANSAAAAASAFDNFDDTYLGSKTSDPTVDNDGDPLTDGDLYFNTTANEMRVYDGANWIAATSAGNVSLLNYNYTATSGQTTFSGADDNAATLSYTAQNLIVTLNGIVLEDGTDYTATNGTSIVLTTGASTGDELNVVAFKSFTTADMVPASTGGTFSGNVTFDGTFTSRGIDDNATSTAITIDSFQNVGIGTTSPDVTLELSSAVGTSTSLAKLRNSSAAATSNISRIDFEFDNSFSGTNVDVQIGAVKTNAGNEESAFFVNTTSGTGTPTERLRVDASGNLLVGKTSADSGATSGLELSQNGTIYTNHSLASLNLNRTSTDGNIVNFKKDGSTVGSIGASSSTTYIKGGGSDTGLLFGGSNIYPYKSALSDNSVVLGHPSYRFKDLYLSGGVYLGGTGSANKLDDYEEGTWTPVIKASATNPTVTYGTQKGAYTKVGRLVTLHWRVQMATHSGGSGNALVGGLPFTISNSDQGNWYENTAVEVQNLQMDTYSVKYVMLEAAIGASYFNVMGQRNNNIRHVYSIYELSQTAGFSGSISYITDA